MINKKNILIILLKNLFSNVMFLPIQYVIGIINKFLAYIIFENISASPKGIKVYTNMKNVNIKNNLSTKEKLKALLLSEILFPSIKITNA